MTDKELRRLRREDLLQILISQKREIDQLNDELAEVKKALEDRTIAVDEAGSIAEAALKLNDVFNRAQLAADQYLDQVRRHAETLRDTTQNDISGARRAADEILASARAEAARLLRDAEAEAARVRGRVSLEKGGE